MAGGMQKLVLCIAQRFLVLRVGIAELLCVRTVDRFGKSGLAVMFEFMGHPIRIKASCANTGHQHDQYHKAESLLRMKWVVHDISLAWAKSRVMMPVAVPTVINRGSCRFDMARSIVGTRPDAHSRQSRHVLKQFALELPGYRVGFA